MQSTVKNYISATIMHTRHLKWPTPMSMAKLLDKEKLIFILIFLWFLFSLQLTDADYFWHLKTGEYLFTQHALPAGDIFSYTRFGHPWVLHEWLFELVLYGMFAWLGPMGVKLLTVTMAMAALGIIHAFFKRISLSTAFSLILVIVAIIPFYVGISPRPQLVSYVFFSFFLYVLLSYKYFQDSQFLMTLPLVMVVWVNAHGGYVIGIALAGMFSVSEWAVYWIENGRNKEKKQRLFRLTLVVVATALASIVNPELARHWLYPFQVMGLDATRLIVEWQSPNFHDWQPRVFLMLVLTLFFSYTYARRKPDLTELVVPTFLIIAGFVSVRHMPLAVLTIISFIAVALTRGAGAGILSLCNRTGLAQSYKKWISGGKQIGEVEYVLNWIVLFTIILGLAAYYPVFHANIDKKMNVNLPIKATDFVVANHIEGKMFNYYDGGGYLIYRLAPDRKVFIDGRADLYGDEFLNDFIDIYFGSATWKEKFDRLGIDYVICGKDAPIRQLLLAQGSFKDAYIDESHAVLLRNVPENQALLVNFGKQHSL